jgi:DNA-binding transcriptional MerR regulator
MSTTWLILAALGFLWLAVKGAASEMFQEEAKTRLTHLPNVFIRLAAMRLPKEVRDDNAAEWRGELATVLIDTDGLPLTRLLRGTRYAMGLFWAAGSVARELAEEEGATSGRAPASVLLPDLPIGRTGSVGYRGPTACSAAGITYRQLDYWARTGLIEPSIRPPIESGSSRLYSSKDILMLTVIKQFLDTGISIRQIRAAINHLSGRNIADLTKVTLLSDGRDVYECVSPDEVVVDLVQGGQGVFGVALTRVWQEVCHKLTELPSVDVISGLIRPRSPRDWSEGDDFQS